MRTKLINQQQRLTAILQNIRNYDHFQIITAERISHSFQ